ncbi:MAG: CBS domain-containing protein [Desulfatibacillaceae bacterium]
MMEVITTHNSSDFDALACLVAGGLIYPGAAMVLPSRVNPNVKAFLSIHKDMFDLCDVKSVDMDQVRRLVVVDTNQWSRLDRFKPLKGREDLEVHVWDHHMAPSDMSPCFSAEEPVGACATLFVREIQSRDIELTPIQATLFLAGIYEDTGNLTFSNTTPEDARAVAYLLEHDADLSVLQTFLRPSYGARQKDVLFDMLSRASRVKVNGFRVSVADIELEGHVNGLSLVVHMYRDILNVDAAFGIFMDETKNRCIIIGRSAVDAVDVGAMMRTMGGGGHPAAGSALLRDVKAEGVRKWIMELIRDSQRTVVHVGDLMSFPVETVDTETPMEEVYGILENKGYSGMPVTNGDGQPVGIISRRDFSRMRKDSQWQSPVKAFMSDRIVVVPPDMSVPDASKLLVKHDIGRLPVMEDGAIIGIFTRSDAMLYYYDMLPE